MSGLDDQVAALETAYGISQGLYGAIINDGEASGATAISRKGAYGRAQLMPATARALGVDPADPDQNLEGGARYVAQLGSKYGWDKPQLVAAAYNAGPGAVDAHGGVPPYPETEKYVNRVLPAYQDAQQPSDADLQASFNAQQKGGGVAPTAPPPQVAQPGSDNPSDADLQKSFDAQSGGKTLPATDMYGGQLATASDGSQAYRKADGSVTSFPDEQSDAQVVNPDGSVELQISKSTDQAKAAYAASHPIAPPVAAAPAGFAGIPQRLDEGVRNIANTLTGGFADKGSAAIEALPQFLSGGLPAYGKAYSANLDTEQAKSAQAQKDWTFRDPITGAQNNPTDMLGDLGVAAAVPIGEAGSLLGAAGRGALQGGALAAINALGHARGGLGQELSSAVLPTVAGAATGGILGGALGPRTVAPAAHAPIASMDDYAQSGVDPMLAVNGGRTAQQVGALLRGLPVVGTPLAQAASRTVGQVDQGIQNVAGSLGSATSPEAAGQALQQGAQDALAAMKARSGALYRPINQMEDSSKIVPLSHSLAATRAMLGKYPNVPEEFIRSNPEAASIHSLLSRIQESGPRANVTPKEAAEIHGFETSKVYYHGTATDSPTLKPGPSKSLGGGIYLTSDADEAAMYARGRAEDAGGRGANLRPMYVRKGVGTPIPWHEGSIVVSDPSHVRSALDASDVGGLTFGEIKAIRSQLGAKIEQGAILNSAENANLKRLYSAMSQDLEGAAQKIGGNEGLAAMKAANAHEAEMHRVVDETLSQVIAKDRSGALMPREQAFAKLAADARVGGSADIEQLRQLKAALPAQAWGDVGAGMIHTLGRDAQGFSTAKFATQWEKITPSAKEVLFPQHTVEALDRFARIAKQMKAAGNFYNHSNSSHGIALFEALEHMGEAAEHAAGGNVVGAVKSIASPAFAVMGGRQAAKLLASPKFARLMLNASKTRSPGMIDAMFARYAKDNPALKTPIDHYRAALARRLIRNTPVQASSSLAGQAVQRLLPTGQTVQ